MPALVDLTVHKTNNKQQGVRAKGVEDVGVVCLLRS